MNKRLIINKWKILFLISLILSVISVLLLSNIKKVSNIINSTNGMKWESVEPYLVENEMLRYSINEINQEINTISIRLENSTSIQEMNFKINYQKVNEEAYVFCEDYEIVEEDQSILVVINNEVKCFCIDILGDIEVVPVLTVETVEPVWNISIEAIAFGMCILLSYLVCWYHREFFSELYKNRDMIKMLTLNDIQARYAGSFFGIFWSFAQPILTILIFWIVFQKGFRSAPVQNMPYILWFIPAYIPWIFFQDVIINATGCMREYSYLVKKMRFKISILPAIKIGSSLVIHAVFLIFMFLVFAAYRVEISWLYFQVFYYMFAMFVFSSGIAWLVSALAVFMKDFAQIVAVILQIGYFAIPIFWSPTEMDSTIAKILQLNPMYYIVQGYRDSMSGTAFFWDYPKQTIYFWIITIIILFLGIHMFEKLKKHFADLL